MKHSYSLQVKAQWCSGRGGGGGGIRAVGTQEIEGGKCMESGKMGMRRFPSWQKGTNRK